MCTMSQYPTMDEIAADRAFTMAVLNAMAGMSTDPRSRVRPSVHSRVVVRSGPSPSVYVDGIEISMMTYCASVQGHMPR